MSGVPLANFPGDGHEQTLGIGFTADSRYHDATLMRRRQPLSDLHPPRSGVNHEQLAGQTRTIHHPFRES